MIAILLLVTMVSGVFAETLLPDSARYVLPEQTVTGSRFQQAWMSNASALTVLSAKDQPVNRGLGLQDNLMLVPGMICLSRFGTDDVRLAVRGMGARSNTGTRGVRVLYDGIPESEPDGQTRLEGIEVGNLDRVEVLRGAGGGLYGNAAGGVVNLRTAEAFPQMGARLDVQGGGFGFSKTKLSLGTGPTSNESGTLTLSETKADGWREHSAYDGQILSGSWRAYASERSKLRTIFYFTNVSADIPGPINQAEFAADPNRAAQKYVDRDVRRYTRKGRVGLDYSRALSRRLDLKLTPYAAIKKLDRPRENNKYQLISRYIVGTNAQVEWHTHLSSAVESEFIGGFDQQLQDGPVTFYRADHGVRTAELLSQAQERQWGQGYFLQWEAERPERWGVLVGGRFDRLFFLEEMLNSDDPNGTYDKQAVTPRVGLRYHLRPELVAFTSVYGGFETPTLAETENPIKYHVEPQKTATVELGLRGERDLRGARLRFEGTLYTMTVNDAIVPDTVGGENFFTNAGQARHSGCELSGKLTKPRWGYVGLAASLGSYEFTDYTNRVGEDLSGKKVAGVSPDLFSAIVRWEPRDEIFAELNVRYSGAAYADSRNSEQADAWTVLGAAIGGRLPVKALYASWQLGAANLTNEKYVSFIQVNDAEQRYFESGMPFTVFGGISIGTKGL
jgi:iron complex outermembrane recepter protein